MAEQASDKPQLLQQLVDILHIFLSWNGRRNEKILFHILDIMKQTNKLTNLEMGLFSSSFSFGVNFEMN